MDDPFWRDYYSNFDNIKKIAKACRYREVVIIRQVHDRKIALRPIKIFKPEHLKFWIKRLNLLETLFDIYISNASVKIPFPIPSDLSKIAEARKKLNEHFEEWTTGYDIFVDVDIASPDQRKLAKAYAKKLRTYLKQDYPDIQIWDTGNGYHLIQKGKFEPNYVKELIMDICCKHQIPMSIPVKTVDDKRYIAKNGEWIQIPSNFKTPEIPKPNIDSSIYDLRRIRRVPYSLHSKTCKPMRKII